jgi:hypothetical protein
VLDDRPHRDDGEFQVGHKEVGHLDAWLLIDEGRLAAVECKYWTSSSMNFRSAPRTARPGLLMQGRGGTGWARGSSRGSGTK